MMRSNMGDELYITGVEKTRSTGRPIGLLTANTASRFTPVGGSLRGT